MMLIMRTTVTLDPDVEAGLKTAMRQQGSSFKEAVNQAIRRGLSSNGPRRRRVRFKTYDLGLNPVFRWDKALALAAELEDEEILRKMRLGRRPSPRPGARGLPVGN